MFNLLSGVQDNYQTGSDNTIFEGGYDLTDLLIVILIIFSIAMIITLSCIIYHYYKKTAQNVKKGLFIIIVSTLLLISINLFLLFEIQDSAKHDKVFFTYNIQYQLQE